MCYSPFPCGNRRAKRGENASNDTCRTKDLKTDIVWLGMADILKQYNYVCERDYTDEKEDFIYFLSSLNGVKQNALGLNEDLLEEDADLNNTEGFMENTEWIICPVCGQKTRTKIRRYRYNQLSTFLTECAKPHKCDGRV